jgi:hypothetical protein
VRRLLISITAFALFALANNTFAAEAKATCRLNLIPDPSNPSEEIKVIVIGVTDDKGKPLYHAIRSDSPAASKASRFKVRLKGNAEKPVEVQIIRRAPQDKFPGLQSEILLGSSKLDPSKEYTVELVQEPGESPGIEVKGFDPIPKFGPCKVGSAPRIAEFLNRNKAVERKISILGGENGTSASIKLTYGMDNLTTSPLPSTSQPMIERGYDRFWRFQSLLDADVSYQPEKNHNYINSINAEADYVLAEFFEAKALGDMRGLFETGLAAGLKLTKCSTKST